MISTLVLNHLAIAFLVFRTLVASSSAFSMPSPIPENEWMVVPPMLHAAIPAGGSDQKSDGNGNICVLLTGGSGDGDCVG